MDSEKDRDNKEAALRQIEQELEETLTEGEMDELERGKAVKKRLDVGYEIRIQAEIDPIAEETARFRKIAKEVDGRYDRY